MYEKIEELKVRLDALRPFKPEMQEKIDSELTPRRIYFTNAFEDNTLTLEETRYYLETQRMSGGKLEREFHEIKGVLEAIKYLKRMAEASQDLTEENIKNLHAALTEPIDQEERYFHGQYKTRDMPILGEDGSRINFSPHEKVPEEMEALLAWYYHDSGQLHPVEAAARFHYRFSLIHPFTDGNGRVARLLDDFILEKTGYGPAIVEDRQRYFTVLKSADQNLDPADRVRSSQKADLSAFIEVLGECSAKSMELMLDILEERFLPVTRNLEDRLQIFDKILSGDSDSEASRRLQEEKETTKLALAREIGETLKQKVRSKIVQFVLSGPAKFQQNNHQYSPLIAEVTARHKYIFSPSEGLYEYHLAPDLSDIEKAGMPLEPFMKLLSFAIISHAEAVGLFSAILPFEFGKVYIKQENRNELVMRLDTESIRELIGDASYQNWDLELLRKFTFDSIDNYFHRIERDYLKATGNNL